MVGARREEEKSLAASLAGHFLSESLTTSHQATCKHETYLTIFRCNKVELVSAWRDIEMWLINAL